MSWKLKKSWSHPFIKSLYVTIENIFFSFTATSFQPCNLMKNFLLLQIVIWLRNCLDFPFWFSHKHIPYIFLSIHKLPSQMKLFTATFEVFLFMGLVMYPWLTELFILSNKSFIFTAMVIFLFLIHNGVSPKLYVTINVHLKTTSLVSSIRSANLYGLLCY